MSKHLLDYIHQNPVYEIMFFVCRTICTAVLPTMQRKEKYFKCGYKHHYFIYTFET